MPHRAIGAKGTEMVERYITMHMSSLLNPSAGAFSFLIIGLYLVEMPAFGPVMTLPHPEFKYRCPVRPYIRSCPARGASETDRDVGRSRMPLALFKGRLLCSIIVM
jgi:hypothetical protein